MIQNHKYEIKGKGSKGTFCFKRSPGSGVMKIFKRDTSKAFSPNDRTLLSEHSDDEVYQITFFIYLVQNAIQSLRGLYTQCRFKKGMK